MVVLNEQNESWIQYNGKSVYIDGIKHIIKVSTYKAIYPYKHIALHVDAIPADKNTKYYRTLKAKLGDDFSVDLLQSDCELQANILLQILAK